MTRHALEEALETIQTVSMYMQTGNDVSTKEKQEPETRNEQPAVKVDQATKKI